MTINMFHPAIAQLLRFQSMAKLRRMCRGFSTRRRFLLSSLGLILAVVWLGQAAVSILLREPTDPAKFRSLVPLGMLAYGLWHVLKVACRRPEEPIEWTPAERELLCGGPFQRHHLVVYRLATITMAAIFKAACFSLLMLPDLHVWEAGFFGSLLALLFLDLIRMSVEVTACGISRRTYLKCRVLVLVLVGAVAGSALVTATCSPSIPQADTARTTIGLMAGIIRAVAEMRESWIGVVFESPFLVFSQVITVQEYSHNLFGWVTLAIAMVASTAWLVIRLDSYFLSKAASAERLEYGRRDNTASAPLFPRLAQVDLPQVPWYAGVGPLAWRQAIGAHRHAGSLLLALVAPGVLACIPLLVHREPKRALLDVVGALAFYSFLLLPAALKFDFRRDVDRLSVLKVLPIPPLAVVAGQIATPVMLASGFQVAVLTIALIVRPTHPGFAAAALLLLIPLNVVIFALDNLIFLLYPHRLNQEGLEVFLRTTLTFTAKGLLFTLGLGLAIGWAFLARKIARATAEWGIMLGNGTVLFVLGVGCMLCVIATLAMCLLVRAYQRFDPSQDTPA